MAAWLPEGDRPATAARPGPVGKARHATLEGKEVALMRVAQRAGQREGAPSQQRVALTDGAEALPEQVVTHVPGPTLGLEIIHVVASLWATAKTVWGETHRHRTRWGRAYLEPRLRGETDAVIAAVEDEAHDPTCTATPRPGVQRTRGYYRRHRPYRHDDEYRARGWPMGTGGSKAPVSSW